MLGPAFWVMMGGTVSTTWTTRVVVPVLLQGSVALYVTV